MSALKANAAGADAPWSDEAGVETLRRMASVDRYNDWIYRRLSRHLGRHILEVGCGIGNMTSFFLGAERLTCIDLSPASIDGIRRRYADQEHVDALVADIAEPAVVQRLGARRFDTVVCINVLEHIEHDAAALGHMRDVLRPGGELLLFVPAGPYLYGQLDVALGHHRRYTLNLLRDLVRDRGFEIVEASYMNAAGIPGWFLSSRVLRRSVPPKWLLRLFNHLTPVFVWCEDMIQVPIGQSIVCIARRCDEDS